MDSDLCGFGFKAGGFGFEVTEFAHHWFLEPPDYPKRCGLSYQEIDGQA